MFGRSLRALPLIFQRVEQPTLQFRSVLSVHYGLRLSSRERTRTVYEPSRPSAPSSASALLRASSARLLLPPPLKSRSRRLTARQSCHRRCLPNNILKPPPRWRLALDVRTCSDSAASRDATGPSQLRVQSATSPRYSSWRRTPALSVCCAPSSSTAAAACRTASSPPPCSYKSAALTSCTCANTARSSSQCCATLSLR